MFSSPILEKASRFPSPVRGKGPIGFPVQYCEKRLFVPQTSTGIDSIGSPDQY